MLRQEEISVIVREDTGRLGFHREHLANGLRSEGYEVFVQAADRETVNTRESGTSAFVTPQSYDLNQGEG